MGRLLDGGSQPLVGQTVNLMAMLTKDLRILTSFRSPLAARNVTLKAPSTPA